MKELIITLILALFVSAIVIYFTVAFIANNINPLQWHIALRFLFVILLYLTGYIIHKRLTNGNKG